MHPAVDVVEVGGLAIWQLADALPHRGHAWISVPVRPDQRRAVVPRDELHPGVDPALAADKRVSMELITDPIGGPTFSMKAPGGARAEARSVSRQQLTYPPVHIFAPADHVDADIGDT